MKNDGLSRGFSTSLTSLIFPVCKALLPSNWFLTYGYIVDYVSSSMDPKQKYWERRMKNNDRRNKIHNKRMKNLYIERYVLCMYEVSRRKRIVKQYLFDVIWKKWRFIERLCFRCQSGDKSLCMNTCIAAFNTWI